MTYPTLDSVNTSEGLHTLYVYSAGVVPLFTPLVLFAIFIVTLLGSYFSTIRMRGDANFSASFAVAGFFTSMVATFMSFIPGMIGWYILVISYSVAIIGFLWLIIDKA